MAHTVDRAVRGDAPDAPLTLLVGPFLAAAHAALPGTQVAGLRHVRAFRWLAAEPPPGAPATVERVGPDRVEVTVGGYGRALVLLAGRADRLVAGPAHCQGAPGGPVQCRGAPGGSVPCRWAPGGPVPCHEAPGGPAAAAAGVEDGLAAFGLAVEREADGVVALPVRVGAVDLSGAPPPGGRRRARVRITATTAAEARGEVDLTAGGRRWATLRGVVVRRLVVGTAFRQALRDPARHLLAEARDGYTVLRDPWASSVERDLALRGYLVDAERLAYRGLTPRAQRSWALGRVAAKDAVRLWLAARGEPRLAPHAVRMWNEPNGRPRAAVDGAPPLHVSLAHRGDIAVAAVGEDVAGIDVERIEPRDRSFVSVALTTAEVDLRPATGWPPDEWVTRLWTVKEAVAKARGTGLGGRPRAFVVGEVDGDWARIGDHWVHTAREGDVLVSTVRAR
ncbi:MAG TPA: 4'-phosphopantetheinyl transferase superfamily protein [Acidimicrobiales bacterium]|nr:4'-phosphopantetheinyl transferase superfamily protein [Acidimicrobiales bacterium]